MAKEKENVQLNSVESPSISSSLESILFQYGGDDPGSDFIKRIVIKLRKDRTIFVKLDTAPGIDTINLVELNTFMRHLHVAFRGYLGEMYRRNAAKERERLASKEVQSIPEQRIPIRG
jgi:hypothetical protein